MDIGINDEGVPGYQLKKLDNGYVVPDASMADIKRDYQRQVRNQIEFSVEADLLGFDYALHPEHHFSFLGSSSPNPIFTQAAIARRTDDIRLLQMANILPWHEPVRLAEQVAMLDLISDGRVDVGIGRGFDGRATETLGQYWGGSAKDRTKNHLAFEEKYEILRKAWTEDLMSHHGRFHDVPPRNTERKNAQEYFYLSGEATEYEPDQYVQRAGGPTTLRSLAVTPTPAQKPHPQVWMPATAHSIEWTARRGINGCVHCSEFEDVRETVDSYYEAVEEAGWPDRRPEYDGEPFRRGWDSERRRGIAPIFHVFNTEVADESTYEKWKRSIEYNQSVQKSKLPPSKANLIDIDVDDFVADLSPTESPIVGDTEEIIDQFARFVEVCGYEDPMFVISVKSRGMSHEETVEQLRSFANDVVPYFEERGW